MNLEGTIEVKKLKEDAQLLQVAHEDGDLGYDVFSNERVWIHSGTSSLVDTGISVKPPEGWGFFVKDRSSYASKHNLETAAGVIDCFSEDMMVMTPEGEKEIVDISVGDIVVSFNDNKEKLEKDVVYDKVEKGEVEVFSFETEDGILEVTGNTLIYTKNGWKPARLIEEGDEILHV